MVTNVRFRYIAGEGQHLRYAVIQRARAKLTAAEKIQTRITYMRPIRLIPVYHEHNKRSLHLRMCADALLFLQNCFLGCGKCAFKEVIMKAILHELNTYGIYRCLRRCLTTAMSSQAICHDKATRLIMKGCPHSVLIYLPISEVCKATVIHRTSSPPATLRDHVLSCYITAGSTPCFLHTRPANTLKIVHITKHSMSSGMPDIPIINWFYYIISPSSINSICSFGMLFDIICCLEQSYLSRQDLCAKLFAGSG